MKSKILYFTVFALTILLATSCEEKSKNQTWLVYYPSVTVLGDNPAIVFLGDTYVDAGCEVLMGGADATDQAVITSNVNSNALGMYTVSYYAESDDGFSSSATRTVYVVNESGIENLYLSDISYGRDSFSDLPVVITENSDGTYTMDDVCAGCFCYGREEGESAKAKVTFKIEGTTLTFIDGPDSSWSHYGEYTIDMSAGGEFDPDTRTFTYSIDVADSMRTNTMYVVLTAVTK